MTKFYVCSFILLLLAIYFFIVFAIIRYKKTYNLKFKDFPYMTLKKDGIYFSSNSTHRIKINSMEAMLVGDALYLKTENQIIIISNVSSVKIFNEYLYITCLGDVKIYADLVGIYRYFSIKIKSKKFNIEAIRQEAIIDFINHEFNINFSNVLKRYIKIIENVLNIHIFKEKIIIRPNKFKFPLEMTYKLNNKIKHIKFNSKI